MFRSPSCCSLSCWLFALLIPCALSAADFEREVLPILQSNCLPCHDAKTRSSGFAVDSLSSVLAGGARHGQAVKPGNVAESVLAQILRGKLQPRMPLSGSLADSDIAVIERWIEEAPPELNARDETKHWAFVKPVRSALPNVNNNVWVRNPIDAFILGKLEGNGLQPAPEAGRRVLIRRLYFDLIGLPPSPEEIQSFVDDRSPLAYEQLVDRLLNDPRYGERWGRHWLDLARYADTNGYEGDREFTNAWRYRDYVVDAFNHDTPYDRFIREQIAGDEFFRVRTILGAPPPEPENAVAMTFLRLGPFNRTPISEESRDILLSEMTSTVGSVFLGLTVGCAKCHDHKYDMIPQRDFYRLKAFFSAVQISGEDEPAEFYRPGEKEWADAKRHKHEEGLKQAGADFQEFMKCLVDKLAAFRKQSNPGEDKEVTERDVVKEIKTADNNNVSLLNKVEIFSAEDKQQYADWVDRIDRLQKAIARVKPVAMSIRNAEGPPHGMNVPETFVLVRGRWDDLGERVDPGFPSAIVGNSEPAEIEIDRYKLFATRGRRMTLANWIASPDNPLTARVMVNRIWQHHFGRGIVGTAGDFGKNGTPPSHPELLDWLAVRFVEEGWSIKAMHRLMLFSSAYRQSSLHENPQAAKIDQDNHLLWRSHRQRLEGEAVRDTILAVSGRLNPRQGGLPVYPPLPRGVNARVKDNDTWETSNGPETRKRSLYIFHRRSQHVPFVETFDAPIFDTPCHGRRNSVTPLQALQMYDSDFVNEEALYFAKRVQQETGPDVSEQTEWAFLLALGRKPTATEKQDALEFLASVEEPERAVAGLCRVLLNSSEFIYVD